MSLVEQAWQATVPPALVDAERWVILELDSGRALVKDMRDGPSHSERSVYDAHVFVEAARESERQRLAREAAKSVTVRSYGHARLLLGVLS